MPGAVKVAISLPRALYEALEIARSRRREGRSEFLRHALEDFLLGLGEQKAVARYVVAYRQAPEGSDEVAETASAARAALAREPWE